MMNFGKSILSLVVPVFNEEDAIPIFYEAVKEKLHIPNADVEIVFVNDGSSDRTAEVLAQLHANSPETVKVINFTRNFGKEAALFAGIEHARGDAVIPIDVDLQDPLDVIPEMAEKWRQGYEVVLARRSNRDADGWLKRFTAKQFYTVHNAISPSKIINNVGDFRLMDRSIVDAVSSLNERQLFMKGVLSWDSGLHARTQKRGDNEVQWLEIMELRC